MVRLTASIAAVTILAGTALAQSVYYDEQFERSVSDSENLEARNEPAIGDYLAARDFDDLEAYEARDFEELEEREPINFGAVRHGATFAAKMFRKHGHHMRKGANVASQFQPQDPNQSNSRRSDAEDLFEREDEELFGRDYDDVEFEARDFDDLDEYEARDFEDLEEREPINFGAVRHGATFAAKIFRKHGHNIRKGANVASQFQPQDPNQSYNRRSDAEDLLQREEFDPELTMREFDEDFEDVIARDYNNFDELD